MSTFFTQRRALRHADELTAKARTSRSSGGQRLDYVARKTGPWWKPWKVVARGSQR